MAEHKVVHDAVHGSIGFEGVALSLLEVPELQRLHSIHQLGLAYLVYPGANHTRFEHSLGVYWVAKRICSSLHMSHEESELVECASLLHDVGHLPFSHTFEFVLHEQFGIDHAEISRRLIRGEETSLSPEDRRVLGKYQTIAEALERHSIVPKAVASLLEGATPLPSAQRTLHPSKGQTHFNGKRYMTQLVNGPVDVDQLDYLKRDAHYTGVAYGVIDLDRLLETLEIFNGDLVVDRRGLNAVEGMLVARALMFSSVYFHKTVRISELMLAKAVEELGKREVAGIHAMNDAALLAHLTGHGGYQEEVATLIKYRRLFKKAYGIPVADVDDGDWEKIDSLGPIKERRRMEAEIAHRAAVDPRNVIIDVPSSELGVSEPRISLTDIRVVDNGKVHMLPRISPIAAALQFRRVHEFAVMVACPAKDREKVTRAAKRLLG